MVEAGQMHKANYQKYLQLAIRGMKDLDYDVSGEHAFLEVSNHNYSIPIPPDSLNIIGVFFQVNGLRVYIPRDKRQAISTGYACGVATTSTNTINTVEEASNYYGIWSGSNWSSDVKHWKNGQFTGGIYNAEGGSMYTFWVNEKMGTIEFSSNVPKNIVIEYLPTAKKIDGRHIVHPFLEMPILSYMKWRANVHRDSPSEQAFNQRQYLNAKMHLKKRLHNFSPVDFQNAIKRGMSAVAIF